jgi:predicted double-glycine peptidase
MNMNVSFFKQETEWTCGPAVWRMILNSMGHKRTENELVNILKSNSSTGTSYSRFKKIAECYKMDYIEGSGKGTESIKTLIESGYTVIVCYYIPEEREDHYSIVKRIDSKFIYFIDPWYGPQHRYRLNQFLKVWHMHPRDKKTDEWYFAVRKSEK